MFGAKSNAQNIGIHWLGGIVLKLENVRGDEVCKWTPMADRPKKDQAMSIERTTVW
jgi:hypothetical protein